MKTFSNFAISAFTLFVLSTLAVAQSAVTVAPKNLVTGVTGALSANVQWAGFSSMTLIPGAATFPVASANTTLYLGFTNGTTADISNMVIYKTNRGSKKITGVTLVKLGGVSNPSIHLSTTAVCPVHPLSATNPCIVRFDPTVLALSALSDYYFVVFFANDTNNQTVGAVQSGSTTTALSGGGTNGDLTHLAVGQTIPAPGFAQLDFLMYVMTN